MLKISVTEVLIYTFQWNTHLDGITLPTKRGSSRSTDKLCSSQELQSLIILTKCTYMEDAPENENGYKLGISNTVTSDCI